MEHPGKMDDLWVPLFQETSICGKCMKNTTNMVISMGNMIIDQWVLSSQFSDKGIYLCDSVDGQISWEHH